MTPGSCALTRRAASSRRPTKKMTTAAPPSGTQLPVEPLQPFPVDALRDAAKRRTGSLNPYSMAASTFDVSFITPVLTYGAQYQSQQPRPRTTSKDTRKPEPEPTLVRPTAGLQQLVRVRHGLSAGAARPRDAEDGGRLLDQGRARRREHAGRLDPADQAYHLRLRAPARLLRRRRGHAHPPVHARAARLGGRRRSTRASTSSTPARSDRTAAPSSSCCIPRRSRRRATRGSWTRRSSSRSGRISNPIEPRLAERRGLRRTRPSRPAPCRRG